MGLYRISVRCPAHDVGWEFGDILVSVRVFKNLCSILSDQSADFDVDDLPSFIAVHLVGYTRRDGTRVNLNGYDLIKILHQLKRLALMDLLPAGLRLFLLRSGFFRF